MVLGGRFGVVALSEEDGEWRGSLDLAQMMFCFMCFYIFI